MNAERPGSADPGRKLYLHAIVQTILILCNTDYNILTMINNYRTRLSKSDAITNTALKHFFIDN